LTSIIETVEAIEATAVAVAITAADYVERNIEDR
jgi:hypothetical protein